MTLSIHQTLKDFLETLQLERYHQAFIDAGATDQDLDQIAQFTEQELSEFLSALNMLPFHSIKFKKAVRELNATHRIQGPLASVALTTTNDTTTASTTSTKEFIIANATIYGKKTSRALTSYEEAINRASIQLALDNPLLISKKGDLFDLAKKKLLEEGYHYKRGSSRSKLREKSTTPPAKNVTMSQHHHDDSQQRAIMMKRQENAKRLSEQRLGKIESLQQQVDHAIQSRQATENQLAQSNMHRDTLTQLAMEAELIRYEETKVKLTKEISKLKAQERKHQWYKRRKMERSASHASQYTDEGLSSQSSSYFEEDSFHHQHDINSNTTAFISSQSLNVGFSMYKPLSPASSYAASYPSSQENNDNEDDEEDDRLTLQSRNSVSSQSSSATISNLLCCPRESDVRASSIHRFDH
ncbi:uncharacterized protein ATC70_011390 [Mucor velutinosus]|uniref:NAB co-repressor domain-containing protein n=1 Tax=Mucor velutinosus TaxID=708070 RepID=A0AAN7DGK1_9FUNG|nr:hypothetical protein ATC70_011390 [Mucor velutinosus]